MGLKAILDERIQHHNLWWVPPDAVVLLPVALAVRGGKKCYFRTFSDCPLKLILITDVYTLFTCCVQDIITQD
jgi:hypothetical protein